MTGMIAVPRFCFRRPSSVVLAITLLLAGGSVLSDAPPAAAQGFGWFGGIFGEGRREDPYRRSPYPGYGYGDAPDSYYVPRHRPPRHKQPVDQAQQDPAPKPRAPVKTATVFIDVFGDSFGQLLANGLDDALSDRADVGIVHMAHGSSGLVNDAYFNWPKAIDELLARQISPNRDKSSQDKASQDKANQDKAGQSKGSKIDVAVMMLGSNDRQPIVQDGKKFQPGSDEWNTIYRSRVMAITQAFQKGKIPLVWVGIPIVKNDDVADDMAALNDIYRDVAARTGATYVDTWEGFSDDDGDFAAYGPDVNGQNVRLRSADGIYFTKAGARKLAHFVEAQVRRDLDVKTPLPDLPTADAPAAEGKDSPKGSKASAALVKPEAGPIKKLGEAPIAKDGRLTDLSDLKGREQRDAIVANSLIKGQAAPAPAGRADNFKWSPN